MAKQKKEKYIFAVGKRKTASARIRLFKGKGENLVNGKPIEEYFPGEAAEALWDKPFRLTDTEAKFYISAKVEGSGKNGQLEAVVHGVSRALALADPKFKISLKAAGLLTRDARERLRRMVGTGGKARREKQSPKR